MEISCFKTNSVGGEGHTGKCIMVKRKGRLERRKGGKKRSEESDDDYSDQSFTKKNLIPVKEKECEFMPTWPGTPLGTP